MAGKSVLKQAIGGKNVGHPHCEVCGTCLLFKDQRHVCPGDKAIDAEILEVFKMDSRPRDGRATSVKVPEGFQEVSFKRG